MTVFQLSIEEVTFALGFLGGADVAAGYLTAITGQLSTDELAGRVTAATHSLLARELLIIDPVSTRTEITSQAGTVRRPARAPTYFWTVT